MSTWPPSSRTAARTSRVTAPTGRFGVSGTRPVRPSLCSTTASCRRRSRTTTSDPERSGAGNGAVSQPRAVRRRAECCSCGSGGASRTASLPSTWVWACSVSHVARHCSYGGSSGQVIRARLAEEVAQGGDDRLGCFFRHEVTGRQRLAGHVGGVLPPDGERLVLTADKAPRPPQHEDRASDLLPRGEGLVVVRHVDA